MRCKASVGWQPSTDALFKNFSSIMLGITKYMKSDSFIWTKAGNKAFPEIKSRMVNPPILLIPDFEKVFEVACDASKCGNSSNS